MSHTDDPTKTNPDQGANAIATAVIPENLTTEQVVDALTKETGKTTDEIMFMEEKALNELIAKTFGNKEGGGSASKETPSEETPPSGQKPADGDKPAEEAVEEEVTVSVKPSLLKPFSNGKDLKEALSEMARRAKEGDETVALFKTQTIPNLESELQQHKARISEVSNENLTLKQQLEQLKAKKPDAAPGSADEGDDEKLPELPDIPEEFDPFNEEDRKTFVSALNTMKERDRILVKRLTAPSKETKPQPAAGQEQPPAAQHGADDLARVRDAEFAAVRQIQNSPVFSDSMRTSRDITDINQSYVDFGTNLAKMCGINNPISENGLFTPATNKVLSDFFTATSEEGERIRSAARKNNILPPSDDELMALRRVTFIRSIQKSRTIRDGQGNTVPIPIEEAYAIAARTNPNLFTVKDPVATRREEFEKMEKATANRAKHTTEVPPALGADVNDLSKIPVDVLLKIASKPQDKWTVEEAELVKKTMKANGLSEDEVKFYLGQLKPQQ